MNFLLHTMAKRGDESLAEDRRACFVLPVTQHVPTPTSSLQTVLPAFSPLLILFAFTFNSLLMSVQPLLGIMNLNISTHLIMKSFRRFCSNMNAKDKLKKGHWRGGGWACGVFSGHRFMWLPLHGRFSQFVLFALLMISTGHQDENSQNATRVRCFMNSFL